MRTPLDGFHQALLNLMEQKRQAETPPKRRRVGANGWIGERVVFRPARNLLRSAGGFIADGHVGKCGTVTNRNGDILYVRLDLHPHPVDEVSQHIIHWELEEPPPTDIHDIEKWLAS